MNSVLRASLRLPTPPTRLMRLTLSHVSRLYLPPFLSQYTPVHTFSRFSRLPPPTTHHPQFYLFTYLQLGQRSSRLVFFFLSLSSGAGVLAPAAAASISVGCYLPKVSDISYFTCSILPSNGHLYLGCRSTHKLSSAAGSVRRPFCGRCIRVLTILISFGLDFGYFLDGTRVVAGVVVGADFFIYITCLF